MAEKLRPYLICDGCGQVTRPEVRVLLPFLVKSVPTLGHAVDLFWDVYEPTEFSDSPPYRRRACLASTQLERDILDSLDRVYVKFRVPYEPDTDSFDNLQHLVIHLHVAAARAFAIKRADRGQLSEEVVSCLHEVERTARRIQSVVNMQTPHGSPIFEVPVDTLRALLQVELGRGDGKQGDIHQFFTSAISTDSIWALVQVELSRVSRRNGDYSKAIDYLDQASISYIHALDRHEGYSGTRTVADNSGESESGRRTLDERLKPLHVSLKEAADMFYSLKQSLSPDLDWKQITRNCNGLAFLPEVGLKVFSGVEEYEVIEDEEGAFLSWSEFWNYARGWASSQLSPSEYRKMREEDEKDQSERRLRRYFFHDTWAELSCRARNRLINADLHMHSSRDGGRESLLNELRVAIEETCYQVIWEPLADNKRPSSEFLREKAKYEKFHHPPRYPGIAEYTRICQQKWYREFLTQQKLDGYDINFLTEDLPYKLSQLKSERNRAEHEIGRSPAAESPQSFYRGFLGIDQKGVLPQLVRIGRKLRQFRQ